MGNAPTDRPYAELVEAPILSIGEFSGPSELLFGRVASVSRESGRQHHRG